MDITFLSETLSDVHLNTPSFGVLFAFIMAILLLFVSGFASASEIAFFSLSPSDVSELEQSKTKKDKHISMLREDNERTLATILIGNNFVNVTIIMLCNYAFGNLISFGAKAYWLQFLSLTVIGRHTNIYPLSRVRGVIPADSIFKDKDNVVLKK